MYDSISTGTLEDKTKAVRDKLAIDFDLASIPFYAEDKECTKILPSPRPEEAYMWANDMVEKGISGEDIQFLVGVLNPDPNARLMAPEILESGIWNIDFFAYLLNSNVSTVCRLIWIYPGAKSTNISSSQATLRGYEGNWCFVELPQ